MKALARGCRAQYLHWGAHDTYPPHGMHYPDQTRPTHPPKDPQPVIMRHAISRFVHALVSLAGNPYATVILAGAMLAFDALLWVTHLNTTLLLIGGMALSQITLLLLPPILHSTIVGNKATQLKLDALLKAVEGVENRFMGAEHFPESHLDTLKQEVHALETEHAPLDEEVASHR